jgi:hypothetical protein
MRRHAIVDKVFLFNHPAGTRSAALDAMLDLDNRRRKLLYLPLCHRNTD